MASGDYLSALALLVVVSGSLYAFSMARERMHRRRERFLRNRIHEEQAHGDWRNHKPREGDNG